MNIYQSISAIQADVDFIGKDKQTQSGAKFKYRGVDQVLNTLHPLFARHKVFAVPEVLEVLTREERKTNGGSSVLYQVLKVKYTFYAEDGTSVSAVVVGEAMDSGDKVSNKCMSVAYKYACFQVLSIPTEETTPDPDDENQSLAPKGEVQRAKPLTRAEIESYGVQDVDAMIKWFEGKCGKPFGQFTEEDTEKARNTLRKKQAEREMAVEARRQFEEPEEPDAPLPWEE